MRIARRALLLCALLSVLPGATARAQQPAVSVDQQPVILVVDVSGSMGDDDGSGTKKIDGAKLALLDYVGSVQARSPIGLRTYPDQSAGGCNSGKLDIPVGPADPAKMSAIIRGLRPDGDTPTAEAMRQAVKDLQSARATHGTLVIVSDGESTCADPCEAAQEIRRGGFDLDTITVGFRISEKGRKQLQCISDALDGRYLDASKTGELRDTLDRLGRPRVQVSLDSSAELSAVAGGEEVEVTATVTNSGEIEARDVIGQLTFEDVGVDVRQPVLRLGNLAPESSREVTWKIRAAATLLDAGHTSKSVKFKVVGRALNASEAGQASGRLAVVGVTGAGDAGEILKGPGGKIVVAGDSYSAGEGSDAYESPTDTEGNGCHRSRKTYLVPEFKDDAKVIACSGAVTADISGYNQGNHEDPQDLQLARLQAGGAPAKAVVMTIGGNDATFKGLAVSCLIGPPCNERIAPDTPWHRESSPASEFQDRQLGDAGGLGGKLQKVYEAMNGVLNGERAVARRHGLAPILAPGYPLPVPLQGRTCAPMGTYTVVLAVAIPGMSTVRTVYLLRPEEIDYLVTYVLRLNAVVESAVETARREHGVPVFYVPTTEMAFQPGHTVCDTGRKDTSTERFARSLSSINGAGVNLDTFVSFARHGVFAPRNIAATVWNRSAQEIAHPNASGYHAETLAILRWSQSRAARDAVAFTRSAAAVKDPPTSWPISDVELTQLQPGRASELQGGTSYPLTLQGFAPRSTLRVVTHSTPRVLGFPATDAGGRVHTRVTIPRDLPDGSHTLVVTGDDAAGRRREVRIPFSVDRPYRPGPVALMMGFSGVVLLLGAILSVATGQASGWRGRVRSV